MAVCYYWTLFGLLCETVLNTQSLPACQEDDGALELLENLSGQQATCDVKGQNEKQVEWLYGRTQLTSLATCRAPNEECSPNNDSIFIASRNLTSTTLTFVRAATRDVTGYGGKSITCRLQGGKKESCIVDIIYSPADDEVSCTPIRLEKSTWSVTGLCHIDKSYSFLNRYACTLQQSDTGKPVMSSRYSNSSSDDYVNGTCTYFSAIPTTSGTYTYNVVIQPGAKAVPISGIVIVVSQTGIKVTSLSCECLGRDKDSLNTFSIATASESAPYLKELGHASKDQKDQAREAVFMISSMRKNDSVKENDNIDGVCRAADQRPIPTFRTENPDGNNMTNEKSSVIITASSAQYEDNGNCLCSAANGMNLSTTVSRTLHVTDSSDHSSPAVVVALTVVLVLLVIANFTVIVWSWRRHWMLPCADFARKSSEVISKQNESSHGRTSTISQSSELMITGPCGLYDSLVMSDVGQLSVYSEIDNSVRSQLSASSLSMMDPKM